jgi:hypothetical protein
MKRYCVTVLTVFLVVCLGKLSAQVGAKYKIHRIVYQIHDRCAYVVSPDTYKERLLLYSGSVYVPDSIYIDNNVYNVTDVTDAFRGSKYLKEVRLPQGLTYILNSAFYECRSLKEITLPDSIICIYSFAFFNCRFMRSVTFPANLQKIMDSAFEGCTSLKEIEIPQHVAVIEESAFAGCTRLKRLVISQSVVSIGKYAFGGCKGLKEIYVYATIPPAIKGENGLPSAFDGVRKSIAVHIPQGTKPLYLQAKEWSSFTNYIDDL